MRNDAKGIEDCLDSPDYQRHFDLGSTIHQNHHIRTRCEEGPVIIDPSGPSQFAEMKLIPGRVQLGVVAVGYMAVLLVSAALIYERHMQSVNNPVESSGGMWAGGDLILEFFIVGLFLIPTFLLVLVIRKSETAYARYSQTLLGLSLTAPICAGVFLIPAVNQGNTLLGWFSMYRLFASPVIIVGLAVSRVMARFHRARRLTSYALLFEVGTVALIVMLFLLATKTH
jgi:hypothetical protein